MLALVQQLSVYIAMLALRKIALAMQILKCMRNKSTWGVWGHAPQKHLGV